MIPANLQHHGALRSVPSRAFLRRVRNALLLAGACALTAVSSAAGATRMEDFAGFWQPVAKVTELKPVSGRLPALKPRAQKLYDAIRASNAKGDRWWDIEQDCLPIGLTRLMAESPFELVVGGKQVALAFEWNRHVHIAERIAKHKSEYEYPAYLGYSIANLRGDALELDSTYFDDETALDATGLPHSEKLRVLQSFTLRDADTLVDTLTITDPDTFAAPWKASLTYQRMPADTQMKEDVCVERLGVTHLNAHVRREAGLKKLGL